MIYDFVEGKVCLSITNDVVFKYVFDCEKHPERIESLISAILEEAITIDEVLPAEGIRLNEQASLVIMDIICRDINGRVINVEMQKIGYNFPGERACCYSADMIMRQYHKVRKERAQKFQYRDIKPTFLIILMEKSSKEFQAVAPHFIHKSLSAYSSGAKITNLSNICYISLDTFKEHIHNIDNERNAWLTFLSTTEIPRILQLIDAYPQFLEIYQEIGWFRQNSKELITMVSEMIRTMDHNTVMFMIDELNIELANKDAKLADKDAELADKDAKLADKDAELADKDAKLADKDVELADKDAKLADKDAEIEALKKELEILKKN